MEKSNAQSVVATPSEVLAHPGLYGGKTRSLAVLTREGFPVPAFVAVSCAQVFDMASRDGGAPRELAEHACRELNAARYAVRSSAFVEDGEDVSHAGEFLSVVDIPDANVADAILSVVLDAKAKGYASKDRPFSLIIQEYIKGDVAGVVFTRNPLGGRDAVCEWRHGGAEGVVGGAPVSRVYQNADALIRKEYFPQQGKLFDLAREIEGVFDMAQDIEWVVRGSELFILQSRPITTIKKEELATYRSIDAFTAEKALYLYTRSGIGESFARCTPLALDVLRKLYGEDGPIAHAYRMLGVEVRLTDNFLPLHGSLYVDSIKEITQFFPAYTYHVSANGLVPKIARWRGLARTIRNARKLSRISAPHPRLMQERLMRQFSLVEDLAREQGVTSRKMLDRFLRVYQDIFLINLYAEDVFRDAEKSLLRTPFTLVALLAVPLQRTNEGSPLLSSTLAKYIRGNSLNIGDVSVFSVHQTQGEVLPAVASWWGNLSGKERERLEKIIRRAQEYQDAREEGRHLSVLLVSLLRDLLAKESGVDEELIFFATIDELAQKKVTRDELLQRKDAWEKDERPHMPPHIAPLPLAMKPPAIGVSAGMEIGVVTTDVDDPSPDCVLLVERLTPNLAPRLGHFKGIVALEGGILSHMAILAREMRVPVVIDERAREKFGVGKRVQIDGGSGKVEML